MIYPYLSFSLCRDSNQKGSVFSADVETRHVFAPGVPLLPLRVFQFSGVVRARVLYYSYARALP